MPLRLVFIVVTAFMCGALGALLLVNPPRTGGQVEVSGEALIGGPFALTDHTGKAVTDQDFRGKYMLVFFGFTNCPDICPTELQVMAGALERLGERAQRVTPILITVDPERDTPEKLAAYVKDFGDAFVGLTGSPDATAAAAKAYRVYYAKAETGNTAAGYLVDHSAFVYLMGPDGKYITHFPYGITAEKMADGLARHVRAD